MLAVDSLLYDPGMIRLVHRSKQLVISPTLGIVVLAGLALASCSSSSDPDKRAATGSGGGNASAIKACDLLTPEEIKQATGAVMGAGQLQTTKTQASCDWSSTDDSSGASG